MWNIDWVSVYVLDLTHFASEEPKKFCPVGALLPGVHVIIMDEDMNVQPIGAPGEVGKDNDLFDLYFLT